MRSAAIWQDRVPERDGVPSTVYDIAFRPDGSQMVVAAGTRVVVYETNEGDVVHSLKGHKDAVYCVSYSRDGERFASGGADKTVIIWKASGEGLLKYTHNDSIQALEYNPMTQQLASVTASDFGLWSPEQKSVVKHKLPARGLCASWTNDGQYLAVGLFDGQVIVFDKQGTEKAKMTRSAPIWSLNWNPSKEERKEVLAVGCWDGTLSFYQRNGQQVGSDRTVTGGDPCSVSYFSSGEYLVVGGTTKQVTLWTSEGVHLSPVFEGDEWVWSCKQRPNSNFVAVGTNSGSVVMMQLLFNTVHGLFQDRYAYREKMTDVVVQHMVTENKVRIRTRDYVKRIAVYRDRLAVQLPDRVTVYEIARKDGFVDDDDESLEYRVLKKIKRSIECNLLVVTSWHIILCLDRKLQCLNFKGELEREWVLDSVIRYIKVVGGPPRREGLLVGLKDGQVCKIFVDNPFPTRLVRHGSCIRCLDLSATRRKLAVVDDKNNMVLYDVFSGQQIFKDTGANSVAFNSVYEDMVCYSGKDILSIRTSNFPPHRDRLQGFVVGVRGSKVFCLQQVAMKTVDVPQSAAMYRFLEKSDISSAYQVATLGVTDHDWRSLGEAALKKLDLETARRAFIRVRDVQTVNLIRRLVAMRASRQVPEQALSAEVMANAGRFDDASKLFVQADRLANAVDMFTELHMYDEAKKLADQYPGKIDLQDLLRRQATWAEEGGDRAAAARLWSMMGDVQRAIRLMAEEGLADDILDVSRNIEDKGTLAVCAKHLRRMNKSEAAVEVALRCGDWQLLTELYIEMDRWDDAFALARTHTEVSAMVYEQHSQHLVLQDKFEEAMHALISAGRGDQALAMLNRLEEAALTETRFADAAHFNYLRFDQYARLASQGRSDNSGLQLEDSMGYLQRAKIYSAFSLVYDFMSQPFSTTSQESVLQAALFLANQVFCKATVDTPLEGLRQSFVWFSIARVGERLGCFKAARSACDKLRTLRVPPQWRSKLETLTMRVRGRPFQDREDLQPLCPRCGKVSSLVRTNGEFCVACGQPFVRSASTFDILPVTEFVLESGINDEAAEKLVMEEPSSTRVSGSPARAAGGLQSMTFDDDGPQQQSAVASDGDPFASQMRIRSAEWSPLVANRGILKALPPSEVLVWRPGPSAVRARFFRNPLAGDVGLVMCRTCGSIYREEEWERCILEYGHCIICHTAPKE